MTGALTQRLQELLDQKDVELEEIQKNLNESNEELIRLRGLVATLKGGWCVPSTRPGTEHMSLPVPRLEVTWHRVHEDGDWSEYRVIYQLVTKHLLGHLVSIPLGLTTCQSLIPRSTPPWDPVPPILAAHSYTGQEIPGLSCELPFRDGVHMHHDAGHLGLELWAVPPEGERQPFRLDNEPRYERAYRDGQEHCRK